MWSDPPSTTWIEQVDSEMSQLCEEQKSDTCSHRLNLPINAISSIGRISSLSCALRTTHRVGQGQLEVEIKHTGVALCFLISVADY